MSHRWLISDIDGTLGDWPLEAASVLAGATGDDPHMVKSVVSSCWEGWANYCDASSLSPAWFWDTMFDPETVMKFRAYPQAAQVLSEMWVGGWDVQYVTARAFHTRFPTMQWLADNRFPMFGWVEVGGDRLARAAMLLEQGATVVVLDDKPDTIEAAVARGIPIVAPLHPYNEAVVSRLGVPNFDPEDWGRVMYALEDIVEVA